MDLALYHALNGLAGQAAWSDHLFRWATQGTAYLLGALLVGAWFWPGSALDRGQRQRLVIYAVAAALLGLFVAQIIGHLWYRDRPYLHHASYLLTMHANDASFPSDHAVGGFALALPFVFARRRLGWVMLALATILALSRVVVGVHYPSDVVGGALLAFASVAVIWWVRPWFERPLAAGLHLAHRVKLA